MIQEDSYWWRDESLPEEKQLMHALCTQCHDERGIGYYWPGKTAGYGDYDLECFLCGKDIYKRETNQITD
jgi:hypothetical protein